MYTITSNLTPEDAVQAVNLARRYYVDLINKSIKPHGATSSLCIAQVEIEVREYLRDALTGCHGLAVNALVAKDGSGQVIGFAIIIEGDNPSDCGVNYVAVQEAYRRQGIMRAMMDWAKDRFTHIGLSCDISKVPYYEALDFRVTGAAGVQVAMTWGRDSSGARMGVLNIGRMLDMQAAVDAFCRVNGAKGDAMISKSGLAQEHAMKAVDRYVAERNAGASHQSAVAKE